MSTVLTTPDSFNIKVFIVDKVKNYMFAGAFDSGSIYIYELPKSNNEKLIKQVAVLNNKPGIVSMHWMPERMELIVGCQGGEVFFWDCVKGKQICNCYLMQICSDPSKREKLESLTSCH